MKKLLSMFVVIVLLISNISIVAEAKNISSFDNNVKILKSEENNDEKIEISSTDKTIEYYYENNDFIIAISQLPNGKFDIVKNDKTINEVTQDFVEIDEIRKLVKYSTDYNISVNNVSEELLFTEIKELLQNKELILKNVVDIENKVINEKANTIESYLAGIDIAEKIDNALSECYGYPYSERSLDSLTQNGYTAYLTESMHFERYKHYSWFIDAYTTITAVSGWMGITQATVMQIFYTIFNTAISAYSIANDVTGNKYVANVHYNKMVRVFSIYPYRAGKTIPGYAYVGDRDASYEQKGSIREDNDFNENRTLMETGINNYINYYE